MFAGLQQVLQPAGYQIMLAESQHYPEREEKLLTTLLSYNLAAAVLLSVEHSPTTRQALQAANIPVVEIGALRDDPIDITIGIDYVAAMYQLTHTLIAGAIRISACCAPTRSSGFSSSICRAGIRRCCAAICHRTG